MSKFTKGPWEIDRHTMADKQFNVGPVIIDYDDVDHEEQDANARLVSAAPDLLVELKRMVEYYRHGETRPEAVAKIKDALKAISKAEGV